MDFYLVIGKTSFYLFTQNGHSLEQVYIDGDACIKYLLPNIKDDVISLVEKLANVYNLESKKDLSLILIENIDRVRNVNVINALGNIVSRTIPITGLIEKYIYEANDITIEENGVNYDGETFILNEGRIIKKPYSLLGVRVEIEALMQINERI